jgi:two-component system, CitB family, response regulator MalR
MGSETLINVLVVEDDFMVAELNKRYVELVDGFKVVSVVHDALEVLSIIDKIDIDLVLLDIFLPKLNGLDLLTQIRAKSKSVDVILVTAARDNATIMQALRFGAIDYIIKPFDFERLSSALLNYKELLQVMKKENLIDQVHLDNYLLYKEHTNEMHLPKGIDKNTLKSVWQQIKQADSIFFSTEEIAIQVGISRVSMRKYLDFLKDLELLNLQLVYGTVGRPQYRYSRAGTDDKVLNRYF